MAIAEMNKLVLIGYNDEKKAMLKLISKINAIELCTTNEIDNTVLVSDVKEGDEILSKMNRIKFAFDFIKNRKQEVAAMVKKNETQIVLPKGEFIPTKKVIGFDEFNKIIEDVETINQNLNEIEKLNNDLLEIKTRTARLKGFNEQLLPYAELESSFKIFNSTKNVSVLVGTVPNNKVQDLNQLTQIYPLIDIVALNPTQKHTACVIVFHNDCYNEINARLSELEFLSATFDLDKTAKQMMDENNAEMLSLAKRKVEIAEYSVKFIECQDKFKLLYDYYTLEYRKTQADSNLRQTSSVFVLEGWVPVKYINYVQTKLNNSGLLFDVQFRAVVEGDIPPTLCENTKIVEPYQAVTNMYMVPSYGEIDPNPFVAVFFFLYFGIMMSDAGYGLIMALGAGILYKLMKPTKGAGKMVLVILMGGISTIIWGILFGGYFAISGIKAVLFLPLEEPISMLMLALALGVVQIICGIILKAVSNFKAKRYLEGILDNLGWCVLFLGIGLFGLTLVKSLNSPMLKYSALAVLALGAVMVFAGGMLGKNVGIFKRILGGFKNYYNIINYFSDILSYSRLFGLGLATGVIGMVFNTIAGVIIGFFPPSVAFIGVIISIPVLIAGHGFNIGINVLGAYVHNCRLQYIEFFGKFYTGGGREFAPLGSKMKYVYIEADENLQNIELKNKKQKLLKTTN